MIKSLLSLGLLLVMQGNPNSGVQAATSTTATASQAENLSNAFAKFEKLSSWLGILEVAESLRKFSQPESSTTTTADKTPKETYKDILEERRTTAKRLESLKDDELQKYFRNVCLQAASSSQKASLKRLREAKKALAAVLYGGEKESGNSFQSASASPHQRAREFSELEKDNQALSELFLNPRLFHTAPLLDSLGNVARRQRDRLSRLKPTNPEAFELIRRVLTGTDPECTKEDGSCPRLLVQNIQIPKYCEKLKDLQEKDRKNEKATQVKSENLSHVIHDLDEIVSEFSSSSSSPRDNEDNLRFDREALVPKFNRILSTWNLYKSLGYFDKANQPEYQYLNRMDIKGEMGNYRDQLEKEISKALTDKNKSNIKTEEQKNALKALVKEIEGLSNEIIAEEKQQQQQSKDSDKAQELVSQMKELKKKLVEREVALESAMKMSKLYQEKVRKLLETKDAINATKLDRLVSTLANSLLSGGFKPEKKGTVPMDDLKRELEKITRDMKNGKLNPYTLSTRNLKRINSYEQREKIRDIDSIKNSLIEELDLLIRSAYKVEDIMRNEEDLGRPKEDSSSLGEKKKQLQAKKKALRVAFVEAALDEGLIRDFEKEHGINPTLNSCKPKNVPEPRQQHKIESQKAKRPAPSLPHKITIHNLIDEKDFEDEDDDYNEDDDYEDDSDGDDEKWENAHIASDKTKTQANKNEGLQSPVDVKENLHPHLIGLTPKEILHQLSLEKDNETPKHSPFVHDKELQKAMEELLDKINKESLLLHDDPHVGKKEHEKKDLPHVKEKPDDIGKEEFEGLDLKKPGNESEKMPIDTKPGSEKFPIDTKDESGKSPIDAKPVIDTKSPIDTKPVIDSKELNETKPESDLKSKENPNATEDSKHSQPKKGSEDEKTKEEPKQNETQKHHPSTSLHQDSKNQEKSNPETKKENAPLKSSSGNPEAKSKDDEKKENVQLKSSSGNPESQPKESKETEANKNPKASSDSQNKKHVKHTCKKSEENSESANDEPFCPDAGKCDCSSSTLMKI